MQIAHTLTAISLWLLVSLLSACGSGGENTGAPASSTPVTAPATGGDTPSGGTPDADTPDAGTDPDAGTPGAGLAPSVTLPADFALINGDALRLAGQVTGSGDLSYHWQQLSGATVTLDAPAAAETSVSYPPGTETRMLQFRLTVSNALGSASDDIQVTVRDPIHEAVKSGNPALLPANVAELESRIRQQIADRLEQQADFLNGIFANQAIAYDPSRNSRFFFSTDLGRNHALIVGNGGKLLAVASEAAGQRSAAFGSNVLVDLQAGQNPGFAAQMLRLTDWLLAPAGVSSQNGAPLTVALMLMSNSHMTATGNWLAARYPNLQVNPCTDAPSLVSCLADAQLIITGSSTGISEATVAAALDQAAHQQQAILYTHNGSWNSTSLTNPLLAYFGVQTEAPGNAGNYFSQDAANWASATAMSASSELRQYQQLVARLQDDSFSLDIAQCDDSDCANLPAFGSEFQQPASALRSLIQQFDNQGLRLFAAQDHYLFEKLLILLADKYRQAVQFPMSKDSTDTRRFLRSLFADHLVYSSRQHNPTAAHLGNFSRTDFSHVTPGARTVSLVSRPGFRSAGVYALPGQVVTVTRTDNNSAATATLFINTQRPSSVRHFTPANGYNRPKFVQSHAVPIAAGQTISLSTPYGGPVQIGFTDQGSNLTFAFANVGLHPHWRTGDDDTAFLNALAAGHYDWAEIATEHFEVHSRTDKMVTSLTDNRWDTPTEMEYFVSKYHHNYHKILSGHRGDDIDSVAEIDDFAALHNLSAQEFQSVQHFNADQQSCGAGCSGNPYDASWAFSVLGHGDLHEVGHNVESSRFKFNGFEGHATTNFYSYYVKSRAQLEDGIAANCQSLPFDSLLADLQASQSAPDPAAYMAGRNYQGWNQGAALIIEMAMHAQERSKLSNGWHFIARMHRLETSYNAAKGNDTDWNDRRSDLGFSLYSRSQANAIDNNDWLLIAASYATGLDYRAFLDLFGLGYSALANDQVASFGYPSVNRVFYVPANNADYCDGLTGHAAHSF